MIKFHFIPVPAVGDRGVSGSGRQKRMGFHFATIQNIGGRAVFSAALAVAVLTWVGCRNSEAVDGGAGPSAPDQPKPIAQVGGEPVFAEQFEAYTRLRRESESEVSSEDLLTDFISQEVLFQAARKAGVDVSDAEVSALLSDGSDTPLQRSAVFTAQVRKFLTVQKFIQSNIGAESQVQLSEMQEYYERHADEFLVGDRLTVLEILVKDRELAESLRKQLEPGNFRGFREIAKRHSVGTTAERGGQLGPYERGDLPKRFEDFIFSLRVGEISAVFRSELGYHIFAVEQLTPRHAQKFYEVQGEVFSRLVADREREALDIFLKQQMESASIEILDSSLRANWSGHNAERLQ